MDIVEEFNLAMDDCVHVEAECLETSVNFACASSILTEVRQDGLSKSRVKDLALYGFNILDDETPLAMFTNQPSDVGLDKLSLASGENIVSKVALAPFRLIASIVTKLAEWLTKAVKWVMAKLTGSKVTSENLTKVKSLATINPTDFLRYLSEADQKSLLVSLGTTNIKLGKQVEFKTKPTNIIKLLTSSTEAVSEAVDYTTTFTSDADDSNMLAKIVNVTYKTNLLATQLKLSDKLPPAWTPETSNVWVEEIKAWKEDAVAELGDVENDGVADGKGVAAIKSVLTALSMQVEIFGENKKAADGMAKLINIQDKMIAVSSKSLDAVNKAIKSNTLGNHQSKSKTLTLLRSVLNANSMVTLVGTRFFTTIVTTNEAILASPEVHTLLTLQATYDANKKANKTFDVIDIDAHFVGED